ncbi:peptidyl-prolyl cis-trans isomerase CYP63-like isoform X1 [Iris pallida]|uniref:Peptidyl-prolyl cis-trans isomerase CYP63-like isoform X1 n=1 Tax=Iris pallida TaxID=29817 RepID=A0AAX6IJC2_IRIPA|nr:peptidyl-prolyl cis-trans isomerase CYP63-like isoform X1 [Iris pallida]
MDIDSPDKTVEGIEDGNSIVMKHDLDSFEHDERRDEDESDVLNERRQFYLNQEYPSSPKQHPVPDNDRLQSPIVRSNLTGWSSPAKNYEESCLPLSSDLKHSDERRISDYSSEEQHEIPLADYQSHSLKEGPEGADHVFPPPEFLYNNAKETNIEFQTEYSYSLPHVTLLAGDNNNFCEAVDDQPSNHYTGRYPSLEKTANGGLANTSVDFHSEKAEIDAEIDGRHLSPQTEMQEDDYPLAVASENGGMVWENSSLRSPQRDQNALASPERQFYISAERSPQYHPSPQRDQNTSPSPERPFSISAERLPQSQPSPQTHPPSRQKELSSVNIDKGPTPSPRPSRRKQSPSPEKHGVARGRASSRDHSSPPRQISPSGKSTHRDSHRRDTSPRRHVYASPKRRDSPRRRSPVRRQHSPGNRREHRRSRSRSPIARDRKGRSPRRRHSPRRRSPLPSYSRHRSPRRHWSPPADRKTGLGKPGNNLFVAGFSYVTTQRDLEKKFSRFGRVTDVRIVRDRRSGESRGFGFLSLERDEDADAAIRALDQTEWNGRILLVEKSKMSSR